jgi:hypothetical protein
MDVAGPVVHTGVHRLWTAVQALVDRTEKPPTNTLGACDVRGGNDGGRAGDGTLTASLRALQAVLHNQA